MPKGSESKPTLRVAAFALLLLEGLLAQLPARHRVVGVPGHLAVGRDHPLRPAGRARGVEQTEGILRLIMMAPAIAM